MTLGVDSSKAGMTGSTENGIIETYTQFYHGKGTFNTIANLKTGRRSQVWWKVIRSSEPSAKDNGGIDANYLFAVLITRENKNDFQVKVELAAEAGLLCRAENLYSQITTSQVNPLGWKHPFESCSQPDVVVVSPKTSGAAMRFNAGRGRGAMEGAGCETVRVG
jgi:hypothetical protein